MGAERPPRDYDPDPLRHIKFAQWWIDRFALRAIEEWGIEEVRQAALRGLFYASLRYRRRPDGKRQVKFVSYAGHYIRHEVGQLQNKFLRFRMKGRGRPGLHLFSELGRQYVVGQHHVFATEPPPGRGERE